MYKHVYLCTKEKFISYCKFVQSVDVSFVEEKKHMVFILTIKHLINLEFCVTSLVFFPILFLLRQAYFVVTCGHHVEDGYGKSSFLRVPG